MDMKNNGDRRRSVSVIQGDGFYFNRILSRESSVGQSSRIYYRPAEGVPFKWEMLPGTPKNQPEEEVIPPLSPPPQLQNKGLPRPRLDQLEQPNNRKLWFWKRIKIIDLYMKAHSLSRKRGTGNPDLSTRESFQLRESDADLISSRNHSCSSSSCSTSFSSSYHCLESSSVRRESLDGPFCCSPWNISAIMEEGNRRVYYCRDHKTAFALENDGSFVSKSLVRVSSIDQSFRFDHRAAGEGIPFQWEMQPGRPIDPPEDEVIPPPSPPPAVQSLGLPLPRPLVDSDHEAKISTRSRIWIWIKSKKMRPTAKRVGEISFKFDGKDKEYYFSDDHEESVSHRDSVSRSSSSLISISRSKEYLKLSNFRRDLVAGNLCFKPWKK